MMPSNDKSCLLCVPVQIHIRRVERIITITINKQH